MSEITVCNFCRLREIRLGLKLDEMIVLVHDGQVKAAGEPWIGCYVIPDSLELEAFDAYPADEKKPYWRASFGSMPTHCIC